MRKFASLTALLCICYITFGQKSDEESIKKSIQDKMNAYENGDVQGRANAWVHDAKSSNTFISNDSYFTIKSWDSLAKWMEEDRKANPKPGADLHTKLENFVIQTDGKMAWVEYDAIGTPVKSQPSIFPYNNDNSRGHVVEFMVKEKGQWKTANRIVTIPLTNVPLDHATEMSLNTSGYNLLSQNKVDEAIEVLKLNVKLFPNSWNTYDSLGEAYALAGKKELAIENYEKSIQLNPQSQSRPAALAKLKQK